MFWRLSPELFLSDVEVLSLSDVEVLSLSNI
jgi:hypothetical protein